MKKICKMLLAVLSVAVAVLPLFGCSKGDEKTLSKYDISAVYDDGSKTLSAAMTVNYVNNTDAILNEVCFHLYPAAYREGAEYSPVPAERINEAYPEGISYGGIEISDLSVDGTACEVTLGGVDENLLIVPVSELEPTESVNINMDFKLTLPKARHRFGYYGSTVNLGNWYPIASVYESGEFDAHPYYSSGDPFYSECADYSISITVPQELTVATSGKTEKTVNADGTATFASTLSGARDYAAAIGSFTLLGTEVDGVQVNYYYTSDPTPQNSLTAAGDALKTFARLYGAYPYESYSVVEAPFLNGGMEYPTLVLVSDEVSGEMKTEAIVHETAHQWWYAAVGNNQVTCAWLDEGLAEFSTGIFYRENPSYGVNYERRTADALSAYVLYYDAFRNTNADTSMSRPVNEYSGAFEYTYMTYVKGELMLEAARAAVGDEAFFDAMRTYYEQNKLGIATPDDLISAFNGATKTDMEGFFDAWIDGKVLSYGGNIGGERK